MYPAEELISERDFEAIWGAYVRSSGDLFQFDDVRNQPLEQVWTIVDSGGGDDGNWYAEPGFHVVNKLGYVMTRKPWSESTPDAIYFLDDFEHEPDELS